MTVKRHLSAVLGAAMLVAAGGTFGGSTVIVDAATAESTAGAAPFVEIVVYDGTTLPGIVAGCSDPMCMGYGGAQTGTVTHSKNYVGWLISGADTPVALYVDGKSVAQVKQNKLITWSVGNLAAGPHNVQALAHAADGTPGWSAPMTITVVK